MSSLNFSSGDKVAQAIDKRIIAIAKQVANKSTVNRTVFGRVTAKNNGLFSLRINNTVYTNVIALKNSNYINVGDKVVCLVPNNQFNDMIVLGVADGTLENKNIYSTRESIINLVYPINSVYVSSTNSNPSTLFGGTWQLLGSLTSPVIYFWQRTA